jgi:hypothetical protein
LNQPGSLDEAGDGKARPMHRRGGDEIGPIERIAGSVAHLSSEDRQSVTAAAAF